MSGFTVSLVTGLAELLDAAGAGTWSPDAASSAQPLIVIGPNMPQTPDQIVCLTAYPVLDDEPGLTEVTLAVQVRCRGTVLDPRTAEDMADAVYDVLHGRTGLTLGGVPVAQIWRQSSAPLGPDTNHRAERSDNYYVQANRATAYNLD